MRGAIAALALLPLLAACGGADDSLAPGGVSEDEAQVLNEAAEMLDANSVSPEAVGIAMENGN